MPVKKAFGAHRSDEYIGTVVKSPLIALVKGWIVYKGV